MTEISCPVCKINSYLNPDIKIYLSPCYHRLCESCLNRIFTHIQMPCPECGVPLRKVNYTTQTFEDINIEREIKIRKHLSLYFDKTLEDFNDIHKYNDYLEDFENIIFELNELSDKEVMGKIKIYKKNYVSVKREKIAVEEQVVEEEEVYDPLWDVDMTQQRITKMHKIPDIFKINMLMGGFTEQILIYKGLNSLYDDNI